MLGLNLFSLFGRLLGGHFRAKSDETQLRRDLLAHRRRELLHRHIPDVYAARETFGDRFEALHQLLLAHDPGGLGELAAGSPYYPELARTLLYQLDKADSAENAAALVQQETSLWFGQRAVRPGALPPLAQALLKMAQSPAT